MTTAYLRALKTALTGSPDTPLVLLCNFEVEAQWSEGHIGLPGLAGHAHNPMVARMEELGVLLAGPDDHLVSSRPLDPAYRDYLIGIGCPPPTVHVPERARPGRNTTANLLDSPLALDRLGRLARDGAHLLPMGTGLLEQRVAEVTGLPLAVPDAATFERVNSKIYSRRITEELGLRPVPGRCVQSVADLADALAHYRERLPIVVKEAYGVSGKGLVVLDTGTKSDRLLAMVRRRAERTGVDRLDLVVEEWLPRRYDLNYQVTIDRSGTPNLDFVKRALTVGGVHKGHIIPAGLDEAHHDVVSEAAHAVGKRLAADGFTGVVGVDAILAEDHTLYPVLEINARLNMSTYQGSVCELFQPAGSVALAKHFDLAGPRDFASVRHALEPLLDGRLVVTCAGTVDAATPGRLYALLVAPDMAGLEALDAEARRRLDG
jgi:hypothetical protein